MFKKWMDKFKGLSTLAKVGIVILTLALLPYLWWAYLIVVVYLVYQNKKSGGSVPSKPAAKEAQPSADSEESMVPLKSGSKEEQADMNNLVSFYNKNKSNDWESEAREAILKINPLAKEDKCPYCHETFTFKAARARKCPKCGEQMIVRRGFFLTEKQAAEYEEFNEGYYDKRTITENLKYYLQQTQEYRIRAKKNECPDMVNYYNFFGECFRKAAILEDVKDAQGYGYFDKAWRYYNKAKVEDMKCMKDQFHFTQQADIQLNMAGMLVDQAVVSKTAQSRGKLYLNALHNYLIAATESIRFDLDYFRMEEVVRNSKQILAKLGLSDKELDAQISDISSRLKLNDTQKKKLLEVGEEIKDFQVIE